MSDFERVWEECWTRVARGEATIDDCLRQHPEHAEALSHLFRAVVHLNQGRLVRPNAAYKARARAAMLNQIRANPNTRARGGAIPFVLRFSFALTVILFLLLVSGTMLAQAALPGDALYGWKTGSENVFRSVYPDPLAADLIVMNRRANDLTRVAGTPTAEHIAVEGYQRVLSDLPRYSDPSSESKIREQLTEQKTQLQRAGVNVPALDRTLNSLQAAPAITPTSAGGTPGGRTTPEAAASPTATETPSPVLTTKPTTTRPAATTTTHRASPTPAHGSTVTSPLAGTPGGRTTPSRPPSATSAPGSTLNPQSTGNPVMPVSPAGTVTPAAPNNPPTTRLNTPTPTPCPSQSPVFSVSSADPCATPTTDCGTATDEQSQCATPTRPGTMNPFESTPPQLRTPKHAPAGNTENPNQSEPNLP